MNRITPLSTTLANQIAAGEVIERPASVIKELLDNAVDANASDIHLKLTYFGYNSIEIEDNGEGIHPDDLYLSIAPHATSKIQTLRDLFQIESMGFRGEALASISAISKLTLISKHKDVDFAKQLTKNDDGVTLSLAARPTGTTVRVHDLFYNTPVRKKFLKSPKTEWLYSLQVIYRFALAYPSIKLTITQDDKKVLFLDSESKLFDNPSNRLQKIMGKRFISESIYIKDDYSHCVIEAWIGAPCLARNQSDKLFTFVNLRMVKDKLITHAIKIAFEGTLLPDKYPLCILKLTVPPDKVDVNVHPTKHDVRFQMPNAIHDAIVSSIKNALLRYNETLNKPLNQPTILPVLTSITTNESNHHPIIQHARHVFQPVDSRLLFNQYSLIQHQDNLYWLDLKKGKEWLLRARLKNESRPLKSRPLLVPITLPFEKNSALTDTQMAQFENDGITLQMNQHTIRIQTQPIAFPFLNITRYIQAILSHKNLIDDPFYLVTFDNSPLNMEWQTQCLDFLNTQTLPLHAFDFIKPLTSSFLSGLFES
jgi:DNA mismatch repair protein MutL